MMHFEINDKSGDAESQIDVKSMCPSDDHPGPVELVAFMLGWPRGIFLNMLDGTSSLLGCCKLDQVGRQKMAWDQKIE